MFVYDEEIDVTTSVTRLISVSPLIYYKTVSSLPLSGPSEQGHLLTGLGEQVFQMGHHVYTLT